MTTLVVFFLLQLVLTVDVARVGTFAMLPNATMTPRSLVPLEGDVSENEELMKMSGLMIYVSQHMFGLVYKQWALPVPKQCACVTVYLHSKTGCSHRSIELYSWPYVVIVSRGVCSYTASEQATCHISRHLHLHGHLLVLTLPCIQEWFHFVDKEKQVRVRIDGKVNQMISDAADLKAWTIAEVI